MEVLRNLHAGYGEFLQVVPLVVLVWAFLRRRAAVQRIAPVLLDVNVALGLLTYLFSGVRVSLWHPLVMFTAVLIAHGVARQHNRTVVVVAWVVVLALVVFGVQIAAGRVPL